MMVDPPDVRQSLQGAFEGTLPAQARQQTRHNMLSGQVLDAADFPAILVHATRIEGELPRLIVGFEITLHGVTRNMTVPVAVSLGSGQLEASGRLVLHQRDFGITPFTALAGSLRVAEPLPLEFDLVASLCSDGHRLSGEPWWQRTE